MSEVTSNLKSQNESRKKMIRRIALTGMMTALAEVLMLLEIALLAAGFLHYRQGGQKHIIFALMVLVVAAAGKRARVILWISVISGFAALVPAMCSCGSASSRSMWRIR